MTIKVVKDLPEIGAPCGLYWVESQEIMICVDTTCIWYLTGKKKDFEQLEEMGSLASASLGPPMVVRDTIAVSDVLAMFDAASRLAGR